MKTKTTYAAATLLTLTALSGVGILVHGVGAEPRQDGQSVTSPAPRTVIMAAPPADEPLCPELLARCAPIPPAPLDVDVPEGQPLDEVAAEYTRAWNEIEVKG